MLPILNVLRGVAVLALAAGALLLAWPVGTSVAPSPLPASAVAVTPVAGGPAAADSVLEDVILYNLFTASRTPPATRYAGPGTEATAGMESPAAEPPVFSPVLVGTAVSPQPADTRALLQLDPAEPARLFAVGDRAGGFRVVSIGERTVELAGPRGRVVLRLPNEEDHS